MFTSVSKNVQATETFDKTQSYTQVTSLGIDIEPNEVFK